MRALSLASLTLLILFIHGCGEPLVILPPDVIPGGTVVIKHQDTQFTDLEKIEIIFDQRPGVATGIIDAHRFEALVPNIAPGDSRITVKYNGRRLGTATIQVLQPPARRVVFEITGDDFDLLRVQPYGGLFDPPATTGERLSYDVLDVDGNLVYSSAIPHPRLQEVESFHDPALHQITRRTGQRSNVFMIKVPYVESKTTVIFYHVKPDLDLTDPDQRLFRRRMAEIRF